MSEQPNEMDDPDEEEESVTPDGWNSTWDRMKERGVPLTAWQFLRHDLAGKPRWWAEYVGPEYLIDVPIEIRSEVRDLAQSLRSFFASTAATASGMPDLQILPADLAEVARGRRMPH
jgi:hypothetical protein